MNKLFTQAKLFVNRNSATILTCVGGAGVVATAVMTAKATPKALDLLKKAEEEKGEELTKLEKVKYAGPAYIPAAITGVATIACIFGANMLNKRQQAALMSAYALLDNSYKDYKKKVVELYGEEVDQHIKNEIVKDKYEESVIEVHDNKQLFYDSFGERYFESTMEDVLRAEAVINKKLSLWAGASLNELYEALDIPPTKEGDRVGWSSGSLMEAVWSTWLDFDHDKVVMDDGLECYIISTTVEPVYDFEYY